jgi:hypothetical protein
MVVRSVIWTAEASSSAGELEIPAITEARGVLIKSLRVSVVLRKF